MAAAAAAPTDVQKRIAARGSVYAHAGQIMLRYFNHEHNHEDVELGKIRSLAREWCKQYFKVPTFRDVPLHQHPKINRQYGTGEPLSYELHKDGPDNPWLLFHPDGFNLDVVPWRRFSDERAKTSRAETTTMKDFYEEPYEFGVLKAKCITARKLNDVDFRTATEHLRYNGSLRRHKLPEGFPENLGITADDLWRDQAIIRYLPEFLAWLGHTPAEWAAVDVPQEQKTLYKNKYMARSGKMFFGRAEKVRLRQGGDGPKKYRSPGHRRLINRWRQKLGKAKLATKEKI